MAQWWGGLQTFTPRGRGSIPGWGTRILQATSAQPKKKVISSLMSIFKNSYIYVCMSEVHHNVNTGYLWVGQLFSNSQKRQLLLVYFFLCSVLFISLWFLNTKGIYVKGYIYIVFFYVDHLLKVLTECVTILLLLFMF